MDKSIAPITAIKNDKPFLGQTRWAHSFGSRMTPPLVAQKMIDDFINGGGRVVYLDIEATAEILVPKFLKMMAHLKQSRRPSKRAHR